MLSRGHLLAAETAAREMGTLALSDALALCLLYERESDPRFEKAMRRWLSRVKGVKTPISGSNRRLAPCTFVESGLGIVRASSACSVASTFYWHPQLGDFEDEFSLVAPWASAVTAQSKLDVLVAPDGKKTWLTLAGNHSTSPTEDRLPDAATGSVNQRTIGGLRT
jgi:hypothetical protein